MNYGEIPGDEGLRKEISRWYGSQIGFEINPDNLFVSQGCSQGFALVCSALLKPGDNVIIEGPTYYLNLKTFADHHVNVIIY